MKIVDQGVIGTSFMDFSTPSEFAKKALYYCLQFGHFYCDEKYSISREFLDMFLLIYVCRGALAAEIQDRAYTATKGEVMLLDCRHPHHYYCRESAEFLWFHFNGNSSSIYTEYLCAQHGIVFPGGERAERGFMGVLQTAGEDLVNEHQLSLLISRMLCQLANTKQNAGVVESFLRPATDYIRAHYGEQITLEDLAELCRISTPYLIRSFKRYLNCTPHEYLLAYRLRQAKQRLISPSASMEQIAEQCGFNSASHFTRAFRTSTGMTPTEFRRLQF